jgi:hypothetical protein
VLDLLHTDLVLADMAVRTQVDRPHGDLAYLARVLNRVPYGRSSALRHVLGGERGGGFGWTAGDRLVGITEVERDADGHITGVTSVCDSRQVRPERKGALVASAFPSHVSCARFGDRGHGR